MTETSEPAAPADATLLETLKRRERQFRESQQIAHVGSWEWDLETDRVEWSDEMFRLWHVDPSAPFSYSDYLARLHPDDRDRMQEVIAHALQAGGSYTVEHRILLPDGDQRWIHGRERSSPAATAARCGSAEPRKTSRIGSSRSSRPANCFESSSHASARSGSASASTGC